MSIPSSSSLSSFPSLSSSVKQHLSHMNLNEEQAKILLKVITLTSFVSPSQKNEILDIMWSTCLELLKPSPTPVETSVQVPVETPVETSVQVPVETSVETPVETSVETSVQTPVQTPVQTSVETSVDTSVSTKRGRPKKTYKPNVVTRRSAKRKISEHQSKIIQEVHSDVDDDFDDDFDDDVDNGDDDGVHGGVDNGVGNKTPQQSVSSRIIPLDHNEVALCSSLLSKKKHLQSNIVLDCYGRHLTRKTLRCLSYQQLLNDDVVDLYFLLIQDRSNMNNNGVKFEHFFPVSFMTLLLSEMGPYDDYERLEDYCEGFDLFALKMLYFPVNIDDTHWALIIVDIKKRHIFWYDSLMSCSRTNTYLSALSNYLKSMLKVSHQNYMVDYNKSPWNSYVRFKTKIQKNKYDCGVYMCMFADFVSDNVDYTTLCDNHMTFFRKHILLSLKNKCIRS